jgi:hypothetical protein
LTRFLMVSGDLKPSILATLQFSDGTAVNLTGCTVQFQMSQGGTTLLNKPAVIVNASAGQVRYDWASGDTNVQGVCKGQFQVTFSDTTVQTFPTAGDFEVDFSPPPPTPTTGYIVLSDVSTQLNMAYDMNSQNFTVYGLTISEAALQAHVDYANTYITALTAGAVSASDPRYPHARIAALDLACLRALVISSGGAIVGAFDYFLGDLRVSRAGPYATAIKNTIQGLSSDLQAQIINLTMPAMTAEATMKDEVPTYTGGLMNP